MAQVADYQRGMLEAARSTREVGSEAEKLAQKREAFQTLGRGLVVTGATMTAAVALVVRSASQWESAWAGVTKTVDGTPAQMERVESGLRGLSKVLPATHQEIAAVAEAAGQLGVETENVVAFTRTMIDLGETTNLSANDAATALARFTNIMGTSQAEVSNLGSALVGLGNNYATTESEILEMSMRLAGAGQQIGMSEGDVLGLATALSSVGIEAEAGGSAMSKVMIDIAASVDKGGDRLEQFARIAGMSAEQFATKWRTAPSEALSAFVKGLANAEAQGSSTLGMLEELGITEVRMRDALLRSSSAADQFSAAMAMGNTEFEKNNALTAEAAKRYETAESKIAMAGNAINDAAISFGQSLLPMLKTGAEAVAGFAGFLGDLPGPLQAIITIGGAAVGMIALLGGTALIAVPQIASFRAAMNEMHWSMSRISLIGGAAGLALTALVAIIGGVSAAQQQARQKAEGYAQAIAQGEDAARNAAIANLTLETTLMGLDFGSAFDNAEKLGIGLDLIADASSGSTQALAEFDKIIAVATGGGDEAKEMADRLGISLFDLSQSAGTLRDQVHAEADAMQRAKEITEQTKTANDDAAGAAGSHAEELGELGASADSASSEIDELASALRDFGSVTLDAREAQRRFEQAVMDAEAAYQSNGETLDRTTEAGLKNEAALDAIAEAANRSAAAIYEQTGSEDEASAALERGREALYRKARQFGMSDEAARAYGDSVVAKMDEVKRAVDNASKPKTVKINADTSGAHGHISALQRAIDGLTGRTVTLTYQQVYETKSAGWGVRKPDSYRGNLFDQGRVQAFYQGGFPSGIYAGQTGGIHKFAESEMGVPWETYISGRAADRERNIGIWQETGRRLGVGGGSPSPTGGAGGSGVVELGPKSLKALSREVVAQVLLDAQSLAGATRAATANEAWRGGLG